MLGIMIEKKITIHVKTLDLGGFSCYVAELSRITNIIYKNGEHSKFIISFSQCNFISPLLLLPLTVTVNSLINYGYIIDYEMQQNNYNYSLINYLNTIYFPSGIMPDSLELSQYERIISSYNAKTFIPLISLPEFQKSEELIYNKFQSSLHDLITRQCKLSGNLKASILYMIDEALNNISDHSQSPRGYVFAQYYPSHSCLHLAISDYGISILGSYQRTGKLDVQTSIEAVQNALAGISTKPNVGRGFGIRTSRNMLVNGLGGSYLLLSDDAIYVRHKEVDKIIQSPVKYRGTCILLKIPLNHNPDFDYTKYLE